MPKECTYKVSDLKPNEIMFGLGYNPSPRILRILAEAIAEECDEVDPVLINIQLKVRVEARKETRR